MAKKNKSPKSKNVSYRDKMKQKVAKAKASTGRATVKRAAKKK